MAAADTAASPGAVVVVAGPGEAPDRATWAFRGASPVPERFVDGALSLAFAPGIGRELHVSDTTACLLEGALYEPAGRESAAQRLARTYQQLGDAGLPRLRGEFWALLWDRRQGRGLVLADQLGCRSPYFATNRGALIVASELPELLDSLSREPDPDPLALAHWLMSTGPKVGTTLFAGVRSIPAGHCLKLSAGTGTLERYWSPTYQRALRLPRAEQAAQLRDQLEAAVQRRRNPDGATGLLLSGGLDSSAVCALASRQGRTRAYSAVFPDHPSMDESELIDRTVSALQIGSTQIEIRSGSTIRGALDYTGRWRVPPTSPNLFFWNPLLERAASEGVEVMLDGEGGDELFAFSPYLVADRLRAGRIASALELSRRWPGDLRPPSRELIWLRMRLAGVKPLMPVAAHHLSRRLHGLDHYAPAWLPRSVAREWLASETSHFAWKEISGPRWWAYIVDMMTRGAGPSTVYEQARRRSSQAGILASHPLVDVDVIELVLRLDPALGFDPRFSRTMLREAIAGLVPDEVRLRPGKSNFDALFHQLLAGPELPAVRTLLDPGQARLGSYVNMAQLHGELLSHDPRSHPEGLSRWAVRIWRSITAEIWLRAQEESSAIERLRLELGLPPYAPRFRSKPGG